MMEEGKTIPTVLLTNDDGPPSKEESPFIESFSVELTENFLENDRERLKVLIPDSQKSWIGKAYLIKDKISVKKYYPYEKAQSKGNLIDSSSNPKASKGISRDDKDEDEDEGEKGYCWYLASGTPATCSNIGLFNLFPGKIDLVISGPNFGRNTSSAFSLSSGTLGAALDAALSGFPSIALSYAIFDRPVPDSIIDSAHSISIKIIERLWRTGFKNKLKPSNDNNITSKEDNDSPDLYSINIPLVPSILDSEPKVVWTFESPTRYARLFLPINNQSSSSSSTKTISSPTKPVEIDEISNRPETSRSKQNPKNDGEQLLKDLDDKVRDQDERDDLEFLFKPDISALIDPNSSHHPIGSDAWALNKGYCTVTPLKACFRTVFKSTTNDDRLGRASNDPNDGTVKFWKL